MTENPKTQTYQSGNQLRTSVIRLSPRCPRLLWVWFELSRLGTEVCQSSPTHCSWFQFSCLRPPGGSALGAGPGSGSGPVNSRSDASELVPEAGRQDALHLLHDEVQRSKQRAEELQGEKRSLKTLNTTGFI